MAKIKNIIIFVVIGAIFVLIYFVFIKPSPDQGSLVSSSSSTLPDVGGSTSTTNSADANSLLAKDFLALLLNIKNIKLDDAIFSDVAFNSLHDSSIVLEGDGTEGRSNPFAKFGNDSVALPPSSTNVAPVVPNVVKP